ncbi:hypothetical protein PY254_02820 [Rhodanobacter sp. AS-Z3]|uniref:hypothetical protein n=1 Tax=Rhodanobacter sp. AS-Z3 TaxID=3031330 RepID=UPI00247ABA08|nr:hypothetical protein [Rhodanobacter sp. AS-Z3]WEN15626.1 hypothetical protein PY254_02820 [Rhodanobacter sp. AS-Z3]
MRKLLMMVAVLACVLLVACAKPLPPDKSAYAGYWRAHDMTLLITVGGNVEYTRREDGKRTSINAPLQKFEGDNFVVGVGPMKTIFTVSTPPYQDQGAWHMTVDGVNLTRDQ